MRKLLSILFSALLCACGKTDHIFDVNTKVCAEAQTSIELTGEKLPIDALGGYGLKVFDSLLVITTTKPDHFRDVYGLNSHSLLAEILRKGHANNEFLLDAYGGQNVNENGCMNLYIHDLNKNVFWKYNLTESVKQNMDCAEPVSKLSRGYQGV